MAGRAGHIREPICWEAASRSLSRPAGGCGTVAFSSSRSCENPVYSLIDTIKVLHNSNGIPMSHSRPGGQSRLGGKSRGAKLLHGEPDRRKHEPAEKPFISAAAMREIVESVVVAFVLAFLFRTFEAEAFVIPTGSMAPTLMGRHKDVTCSKCGYPYRVERERRNGSPRPGSQRGDHLRHLSHVPLHDGP